MTIVPSQTLLNVIEALSVGPGAVNFLDKPPKKDLPDYYRIIQKPIGLNDVKRGLEKKRYKFVVDCVDDIQLIWKNCKKYNIEGSLIYELAVSLEKLMNEKLLDNEIDMYDDGYEILKIQYLPRPRPIKKKKPPTPPIDNLSDSPPTPPLIKREAQVKRETLIKRETLLPPKEEIPHSLEEQKRPTRSSQSENRPKAQRNKRVQEEAVEVRKRPAAVGAPRAPSVFLKLEFSKALQAQTIRTVEKIIEYGLKMYPEYFRTSEDGVNYQIILSRISSEFLADLNSRFNLKLSVDRI